MAESRWHLSDRKAELPADWAQRRRRRLEADGHRCQWPRSSRGICGSPATDVDHRVGPHAHEHADLWSLCRWHHNQKTAGESAESRRAILAKLKHPVETLAPRRP